MTWCRSLRISVVDVQAVATVVSNLEFFAKTLKTAESELNFIIWPAADEVGELEIRLLALAVQQLPARRGPMRILCTSSEFAKR